MLARHQMPISSRGKSRPPYLSLRLVARSPQGGEAPELPPYYIYEKRRKGRS